MKTSRAPASREVLRFGHCEVHVDTHALLVAGHPIAIEPRPFELLVHLMRHRHRVVSKQELLDRFWPGRAADTSALGRAVMKLRRAIGDASGPGSAIRSVPRVGYRFVAALAHDDAPAAHAVTLALLPLDSITGDDGLDWAPLGLTAMVASALSNDARLSIVSMTSVLETVEACADATPVVRITAVQRHTGANVVMHGHIASTSTGYRVDLRLTGQSRSHAGAVVAERFADLAGRMAQEIIRIQFEGDGSMSPVAGIADGHAAVSVEHEHHAGDAASLGRQPQKLC